MWRSLRAVTPAGSGPCPRSEQFVGVRDDGADDALASVVHVTTAAGRGRKDEVLRLGVRAGVTMAGELVAQRREDVDQPDPGLGLGVPDGDPAVRQVDVPSAQRGRLSDPQTCVDERRDQGAAAGGLACGLASSSSRSRRSTSSGAAYIAGPGSPGLR